MKLMETLVESVLLYGAEVWGCGRQLGAGGASTVAGRQDLPGSI